MGLLNAGMSKASPRGAGTVPGGNGIHSQDSGTGPTGHSSLSTYLAATKFGPMNNGISLPDLAEGFNWQPKQPPRPGMFSERPKKKNPNVPLASDHEPVDTSSCQNPPTLHASHLEDACVDNDKPRLELPEFSFESPRERPIVSSRQDVTSSSYRDVRSSVPLAGAQGPSPINHTSDESYKLQARGSHTTPTRPSHKEANSLNPAELMHTGKLAHNIPTSSPSTRTISPGATGVPFPLRTNAQELHDGGHILREGKENHQTSDIPSFPHQDFHISQRPSPPSVCGDLEGPTYRPPRQHVRSPKTGADYSLSLNDLHMKRDWSRNSTQRSQSRSSNISMKRAAIQNSAARVDPQRKKVLMERVARHWNECLEIAELEKEAAIEDVRCLQGQVKEKSNKLSNAESMLSRRQAELDEMQNRYGSIEEKHRISAQENEALAGEVEDLRKALSESKERLSQMGEKCKSYKHKINEAIGEQQDLYKRSRNYYQKMLQELESAKSEQDAKASAVDEALKESQQKREEMRKTISEYQSHANSELKKSKFSHIQA